MSFPCIPSRRFPPSLYAILHANRRPAIRHGKSRRGTRSCNRAVQRNGHATVEWKIRELEGFPKSGFEATGLEQPQSGTDAGREQQAHTRCMRRPSQEGIATAIAHP